MSYRVGRILWACARVPLGALAVLSAATILLLVWFCSIISKCFYEAR